MLLPRERGDEAILTSPNAGECVGEMAMFDHRPRYASVVAREDNCLLKIDGTASQELHDRHVVIRMGLFLLIT